MVRVLVAGGTGLVGRSLVERLVDHGQVEQVIAPTRRALPFSHAKLVTRMGALGSADAALELDLEGAEVIFCCLGTTLRRAGSKEAFRAVDHDLVVALGRRAAESGVSRFLCVSSLGADPDSRVFYSRVKGETERDLQKLGLSLLVLFRPSLLLGEREVARFGERLAQGLSPALRPLLVGGLRGYRPIEARTVAGAMVHVAFSEELERGVHVLSSDTIERWGN